MTNAEKALMNNILPRIARSEELASTLTTTERRTLLRLLRKFNGIAR